MDKPLIKNIIKNENAIELLLSFPKELDYFKGHFPNVPILPGVAQIHWAMKFAEEYFGIVPNLIEMKSVKFSQIITPDIDITLKLSQSTEKNKVNYAFYNGTRHCSSGIFVLQN